MDIAVISVITSGFVAIAGTLIPLITDYLKWSREQKTAKSERLDKTTTELIGQLGIIRSGSVRDATGKPYEQTHALLISSFFNWELAIRPYCKKTERERLESLRSIVVTSTNAQTLYDKAPEVLKEIIDLCTLVNKQK